MMFNYRHITESGRPFGRQKKTKSGRLPIHFSVQNLIRTKRMSTQNQFLFSHGLIHGGALWEIPVITG